MGHVRLTCLYSTPPAKPCQREEKAGAMRRGFDCSPGTGHRDSAHAGS
jgi:hypothetical protein